MKSDIKVSVVTVTYNCEKSIEKTITSVISQTYNNLEYVVIDGASTDTTKDIVEKFSNKITVFISEPDAGIFDAMNKALLYATGKYIIYLNAGDYFYSNHILEDIMKVQFEDADLIYGDVYFENELGLKLEKASSIYEKKFTLEDLVYKSQGFCHQSLLTKTEILKRVGFSLKYPIGADYDSTYKVFCNGNHKIKYVGFPISVFSSLEEGASHNGRFMKGIYDERCEMFGLKKSMKYHIKIFLKKTEFDLKSIIIKTFPKSTAIFRKRRYGKR